MDIVTNTFVNTLKGDTSDNALVSYPKNPEEMNHE